MTEIPLEQVAELLDERNRIDERIAQIIQRPVASNHLIRWIASRIFDIELEESATAPISGRFRAYPLAGKTVKVKWYPKREGVLDMTESDTLDYYLVLTGPPSAASTSSGGSRPWHISDVYLFDAHRLLASQRTRGVKIGTASSVPNDLWTAARIYPDPTNPLPLSREQIARIELFRPQTLGLSP